MFVFNFNLAFNSMSKTNIEPSSIINVCLVSPLPPPYGGISHWTKLILDHSEKDSRATLQVVDTAIRWREVHDLAFWKRVIFGGMQLVRDFFKVSFCVSCMRPDVIHLTTAGRLGLIRDFAVVILGKIFKTPVVYHIRFGRLSDLFLFKNFEWRFFVLVAKYASCLISIDRKTFETLLSVFPENKVVLIPNCFDPRDFIAPSSSTVQDCRKSVVYLGWVIPTKGIGELVEAWRLVRRSGWKLIVVGPGDKDFISGLRQIYDGDDIQFVGGKSHPESIEILRSSGIFVLPSYTEGFPNVIVEAMALGLPIVATAVGAIPEMIGEGRGVLVPMRDAVALSIAIRELIDNSDARKRLGELAQEKAYREYSVDAVYERYVNVWNTVSGSKIG